MPIRESVRVQRFRTRSRAGSGTWRAWEENVYTSSEYMPLSINHMPINTDGDDGGAWFLSRIQDLPTFGTFEGVKNSLLIDGEVTVQKPPAYIYQDAPSVASTSELDSFGSTAIARSAPTNPAFDLSTSLGELVSDGLPSVVGAQSLRERAKVARSAGGEYLNVQFGWLPLLSDLRSFAKTVKNSHQIMDQYRRDSDIKIRRAYDGPTYELTKFGEYGNMYTVPVNTYGPGFVEETIRRRQWFRGAFKYHIPVADDTIGKFQQWVSMSDHLLGWKVTPETVWNIAPWSWAADWFTNTGDIMANISNLGRDGLVMQYGYSMAERSRRIRMAADFYARYGQHVHVTRDIIHEYKQRRPATPYGFGVNLSTLSPKQVAVIAALGLSRT